MIAGPRKILFKDVALNTLGTFVAGFIGSILLLLIVFMTSNIIDIPGTFARASL